MSSTSRGYERHKTDYYVTPLQCIRDFFSAWLSDIDDEPEYNFVSARPDKVVWLDPCAGGDSENPMSYPSVIQEVVSGGGRVISVDIREDSLADLKENYLEKPFLGCDVIITNPPFLHAQAIIEKALREVNEGGYVIMLLRLNFFGSKARKKFFQENMPGRVYVHNRRMSFTKNGKTDSIEYMHAVWKKDEKALFSKLKVI